MIHDAASTANRQMSFSVDSVLASHSVAAATQKATGDRENQDAEARSWELEVRRLTALEALPANARCEILGSR